MAMLGVLFVMVFFMAVVAHVGWWPIIIGAALGVAGCIGGRDRGVKLGEDDQRRLLEAIEAMRERKEGDETP